MTLPGAMAQAALCTVAGCSVSCTCLLSSSVASHNTAASNRATQAPRHIHCYAQGGEGSGQHCMTAW